MTHARWLLPKIFIICSQILTTVRRYCSRAYLSVYANIVLAALDRTCLDLTSADLFIRWLSADSCRVCLDGVRGNPSTKR